jgi:hypothetical protein
VEAAGRSAERVRRDLRDGRVVVVTHLAAPADLLQLLLPAVAVAVVVVVRRVRVRGRRVERLRLSGLGLG